MGEYLDSLADKVELAAVEKVGSYTRQVNGKSVRVRAHTRKGDPYSNAAERFGAAVNAMKPEPPPEPYTQAQKGFMSDAHYDDWLDKFVAGPYKGMNAQEAMEANQLATVAARMKATMAASEAAAAAGGARGQLQRKLANSPAPSRGSMRDALANYTPPKDTSPYREWGLPNKADKPEWFDSPDTGQLDQDTIDRNTERLRELNEAYGSAPAGKKKSPSAIGKLKGALGKKKASEPKGTMPTTFINSTKAELKKAHPDWSDKKISKEVQPMLQAETAKESAHVNRFASMVESFRNARFDTRKQMQAEADQLDQVFDDLMAATDDVEQRRRLRDLHFQISEEF